MTSSYAFQVSHAVLFPWPANEDTACKKCRAVHFSGPEPSCVLENISRFLPEEKETHNFDRFLVELLILPTLIYQSQHFAIAIVDSIRDM